MRSRLEVPRSVSKRSVSVSLSSVKLCMRLGLSWTVILRIWLAVVLGVLVAVILKIWLTTIQIVWRTK